jgi:hypothetical protein
VISILTVFIYHSTRFFNLENWHVKNSVTYLWVEVWNAFATNWMMPLIFVISGASIFYALGKGGFGKFLKDKVLRLLVPLLVGAFTHASLQVYLERLTHGQFSGSYFEFLPFYFQGVYDDGDPMAGNFAFHGMHLWYLLFLFLFSLIFYPLLRWLRGGGRGLLAKLGDLLALPGVVYTLALPIILLSRYMSEDNPLRDIDPGGWGMAMYMCFFVAGFVIVSHERLQAGIRRLRWLSLGLGLPLLGIHLLFEFQQIRLGVGELRPLLLSAVEALASWSIILAILGFAMQHLTKQTAFLSYSNEAVLPFYILHQTVLLSVGYFVVQWHLPDLLKWLVIVPTSFAIIMGMYEYLVRRNNVLRFLFGMKLSPARPVQEARQALQVS